MHRIHGTDFAKATNQSFKGQTTHLQKAAEAQNPNELSKAMSEDKFARATYDEFVQIASTFVANDQSATDLDAEPGKVSLLDTSHKVTFQMAREVGVGPLGLAWGALRGFDKVVDAPNFSGVAVLRELPEGQNSNSVLDRIESLSVKTRGSAPDQSQYKLSRSPNGNLIMETNTKVKFYSPNGTDYGGMSHDSKVIEEADGRLTAARTPLS